MSGFTPIFPLNASNAGIEPSFGICVRDYAAILILAGMGQWIPEHGGPNLATTQAMKARALWAREQADSLMSELEPK